MYKCQACQADLQTGWKACPHCGEQFDAPVPEPGINIPPVPEMTSFHLSGPKPGNPTGIIVGFLIILAIVCFVIVRFQADEETSASVNAVFRDDQSGAISWLSNHVGYFIGGAIGLAFSWASYVSEKRKRRAYATYRRSLERLTQDPGNLPLRQETLMLGREYATLMRNSKGRTIFDEMSIMNDLNAAGVGVAPTRGNS